MHWLNYYEIWFLKDVKLLLWKHHTISKRCNKIPLQDEPWREISSNVVCATSKGSDQPAHTHRLIRAFASRLNILWLLSYTGWVSFGVSKLKGGYTGMSESTPVKMPHCVGAQISGYKWQKIVNKGKLTGGANFGGHLDYYVHRTNLVESLMKGLYDKLKKLGDKWLG